MSTSEQTPWTGTQSDPSVIDDASFLQSTADHLIIPDVERTSLQKHERGDLHVTRDGIYHIPIGRSLNVHLTITIPLLSSSSVVGVVITKLLEGFSKAALIALGLFTVVIGVVLFMTVVKSNTEGVIKRRHETRRRIWERGPRLVASEMEKAVSIDRNALLSVKMRNSALGKGKVVILRVKDRSGIVSLITARQTPIFVTFLRDLWSDEVSGSVQFEKKLTES